MFAEAVMTDEGRPPYRGGVTSPFSDLERPPLRAAALRKGLAGGLWTDVRVLDTSPSTNAEVAAAARAGAPEGLVVVAESQTAGRGRRDREWTTPPRAGLTFSLLLRPSFPTAGWGWLPLLAGLAVATPLGVRSELDVRLKWPNDVLVGERKLGGILTEVVGSAVVVGIGLNVSLRPEELPVPTATSLAIEGSAVVDRDPVLRAVLRELERRYVDLARASGDAAASGLGAAYREACATLGREVRVELPGGRLLEGTAVDVDAEGRLLVASAAGRQAVAAGDVVHVR
jgi:BirA family transcriptional regulator, biotin operon repressor / biotin---[acetyl-CoA-carboxylase] ligase